MAKPKGSFLMKKKILFLALFFILCPFLTSRPLYAATISSFTVSPTSVTFADQDPDLGEVTSSPSVAVTFSIRDSTRIKIGPLISVQTQTWGVEYHPGWEYSLDGYRKRNPNSNFLQWIPLS